MRDKVHQEWKYGKVTTLIPELKVLVDYYPQDMKWTYVEATESLSPENVGSATSDGESESPKGGPLAACSGKRAMVIVPLAILLLLLAAAAALLLARGTATEGDDSQAVRAPDPADIDTRSIDVMRAPTTTLMSPVAAGDTELPVLSTVGFDVGGTVFVEGGGNSEMGVIASIGSIVLTAGLANDYPAGSTVSLQVSTCNHFSADTYRTFGDTYCFHQSDFPQYDTKNLYAVACTRSCNNLVGVPSAGACHDAVRAAGCSTGFSWREGDGRCQGRITGYLVLSSPGYTSGDIGPSNCLA